MYSSGSSTHSFHPQGSYTCPVCRHGHISSLTLMDAFACNFCQHIFSVNWEQQLLQMADSQLPLTWRWNGRTWQGVNRPGVTLGWEYGFIGLFFVLFPPILIALSAYLFPPLPGSSLFWFPWVWTALAFFTHLTCLLWLVAEYYQFPVLLYLRTWGHRLFHLHRG